MSSSLQLNQRAHGLIEQAFQRADELRIASHRIENADVLDFGVAVSGGLNAGCLLARICMSDLGTVQLQSASAVIDVPQVMVHTDHPLAACLQSQYAGWKVATDDFFGMGSGPMRVAWGREDVFRQFPMQISDVVSVGVLEAGTLPTSAAVAAIQDGVGADRQLFLAVAPTASTAGNLQVVARSLETALHKLHELEFPVEQIVSGCGSAPLPPVARNDLEGIGRTNDSILYGSTVNLWVRCKDELIEELGPGTPSSSSTSHGESFLNLFKAANHDFYALDKALFSPAVVVFHNLDSGNTFRFGSILPDLLHASFGM